MAQVYKKAALEAARLAGLDPEMDRAAEKVKRAIVAEAGKHTRAESDRDTEVEHFASSFSVQADYYTPSRVMDRVVSSDHPAALSIEYGHMTRRAKGRRLRRWVPGLMIVNEAVNRLR